MAKFIYKMDNILGIKVKMEDQARTYYGIARRRVIKEEEKLQAKMDQLEEYHHRSKELDIMKLREYTEASESVRKEIKLQELAVKKAEQQLEYARIKLKEAMVERKVHEKLKENAKEVFFLETASEERKEVDELVSFRFNDSNNREAG